MMALYTDQVTGKDVVLCHKIVRLVSANTRLLDGLRLGYVFRSIVLDEK